MPIPLEEILSRLQIKGGSTVGGSSTYASYLPILNSQGVLDPSFFAGAITVTEVANQAARLALSGLNIGDLVKQTDNKTTYVLRTSPSNDNASWTVIGTDYANESTGVSYDPSNTTLTSTDVQSAIDELWTTAVTTIDDRTVTGLVTFNRVGAPFAIGSNATGQLVTGLNADLVDGQHGAYYRNATNINAGTLDPARLSGTYPISISGTAAIATVAIGAQEADHAAEADTATNADHAALADEATTALTANDADNLNGQLGSFYQDAANLNAGTLPAARFDNTSHGQRTGGTLHALATIFDHGFLSKDDKYKIDSIEAGAEPNQNAFSGVLVNGVLITAATETDTFEIASVADEIIVTTDLPNKKVILDFDLGNLSHSTLANLTADDHTQYVHKDVARTITAVHTFAPGSLGAPFQLGGNAYQQTVLGLSAEYLNGKSDTFFQNASNLNAGIVPANRLVGSYNISITGTAGGALPSTGGTLTGPLTVPGLKITGLANPVSALATDSLGNVVAANPNVLFSEDSVQAVISSFLANTDNVEWTYNSTDDTLEAAIVNLTTDDVAEGTTRKYVTWTNVENVLQVGAGLVKDLTSLRVSDRVVLKDVSDAIVVGDITAGDVSAATVETNLLWLPDITATHVDDPNVNPTQDGHLVHKKYLDAAIQSVAPGLGTYDLPVTVTSDFTTLDAKIGEIAVQNSQAYALIKLPASDSANWLGLLELPPATVGEAGFISSIERGELLRLATLVESQAAATIFCPALRVTEPLKGTSAMPSNYTNEKWSKFNSRSIQVRGRRTKKYFLLLAVKGWVSKHHKWEITYYKNGALQAPIQINAFEPEQPPRGVSYIPYQYLDTIVPIYVDGQTPITLNHYAFNGQFSTGPSSGTVWPGIAPFSGKALADPFNGGFVHIEGKGVWSENINEPFQPYTPDLLMLQSEGESLGGGISYYPEDPSQDARLYDGETIYDAQDITVRLKRTDVPDEDNEVIPTFAISTSANDTVILEKARARCNYTVFNKLSGFNGFLRTDSSIKSGKGLTAPLAETADKLTQVPLTSNKLWTDITQSTILVKGGDAPIEIDITGLTNLKQVLDAMNADSNLSASYNPTTDRFELHDDTTPKTDETIAPPHYYDATDYPDSQVMRVLRIGFGGTDTWTGASLPVASGLRATDTLAALNLKNPVALNSGNQGKFYIDNTAFTYDVTQTLNQIATLVGTNYSLSYNAEANEMVLKRKDGTTTDFTSVVAPRTFDVKGNLMAALGLDKESHGNTDFPIESVHNLRYQDDGIIAVGNFRNYCGSTSAGIAKLKFDGKPDPFFNVGIGFDSPLWSVVGTDDNSGDILVAGLDAASFKGYNRKNVFRLKQTGVENTTLNLPYANLSSDNQSRVLSLVSLNGAGDFAVLTPRKLLVFNSAGVQLRSYSGTKSFHGMTKYREDGAFTYFILTSQAYVGPTTTQKFNSVGEPLGLRLMVYDHSTNEVKVDPTWAQMPVWNNITGYGAGAGTGAEASCAYPIVGGTELDRYVICGNRGAWWGSEIEDDAQGNTSWNERGAGNLILESENFAVPTDTNQILQSSTNANIIIELQGDYKYETQDGYIFLANANGTGWNSSCQIQIAKISAPNTVINTISTFTRNGSNNYTNWFNVDTGDTRPNQLQVRFKDVGPNTGAHSTNDQWSVTYTPPAIPVVVTQSTAQPTITVTAVSGPFNPQSSSDELRGLSYEIEVLSGGAWGVADIRITPSILSPDAGGDTVQNINDVQVDTFINLGSRGLKFKFTRPSGNTDTLATGSKWKVVVWPWQEAGLGLDPIVETVDGFGRTVTTLTNDTSNSSEVGYLFQEFDATNVRMWANGTATANNGNVEYVMVALVKKDAITDKFPYIGLEFGSQSSFVIGCRLNTATGAYDADLPPHDLTASVTVEGNLPSNPDYWIVKLKTKDTSVANTKVKPVIYPAYTNVFVQGAKTPVTRSLGLYGVALQYEPWNDAYVRTTTQPVFVTPTSSGAKFRGLYKIGLEGSKRGKADANFATYLVHSEPQSHPIPFGVDKQNRIYVGGAIRQIQKADNSMQDVTPWRLYRLTENGKFDREYEFNDTVTSCIVTPTDKLVVGGRFTCYNKRACGKIAFLTLDGDVLDDITPSEDDVITSNDEPDVDLYPAYKDKLWLDTSVEPPLLKVYDDNEDTWVGAFAASMRISDPAFRTEPANTLTDPSNIYIDVPGFTVKASGWTDPKDVKVEYRINDQNGTPITYDPAVGVVLPSAGSYTVYAQATAPASVEWYNSRMTYQYFTVRAQCLPPEISTADEGSGVRVTITTVGGTLGSTVQYYYYPVGTPPQSVTWVDAGQATVSFVVNKNVTVKAKAVKTGNRDSAVATADVTITVGSVTIAPQAVGGSVTYIDSVLLTAGVKGTGVLYSIAPSTVTVDPTIDNYLHNNTGGYIRLGTAASWDVDLMDETLQESYFGGSAGTSCVVKARTVIVEEVSTGVFQPVVEQTNTVTTTINRDPKPTITPNGYLVKNDLLTNFKVEIAAPASKTVKYDIFVTPATPTGDVTVSGDPTASYNGTTQKYEATHTITATNYQDFVFRTRVFSNGNVPSQRVTVPFYWKRPGPVITLINDATFGITKFTITPQLSPSSTRFIRYTFNPGDAANRTTGLVYTIGSEVSLEDGAVIDGYFQSNSLNIRAIEYDTNEDSKYDAVSEVNQARVDAVSPTTSLFAIPDGTVQLTEAGPNVLTYDTTYSGVISFNSANGSTRTLITYNNATLITSSSVVDKILTSSTSNFNPPLVAVNSGTLNLRLRQFKSGKIPSKLVSYPISMKLPNVVFNPPSFTNFKYEGNVKISNALSTATVHYTMDNTAATGSSAKYYKPIQLRANAFIRAVATKIGWIPSGEQIATYTFDAEPWSIIALPDTQHYSERNPWIYDAQCDWALSVRTDQNLKAVFSLGDMVEHGESGTTETSRSSQASDATYNKLEWVRAYKAMHRLDAATDLIWTPNFGNHDISSNPSVLCTSVNTSTNKITFTGTLPADTANNAKVSFWGDLPAPLTQGTGYYIRQLVGSTFEVTSTIDGSAIDLTTTGNKFVAVITPTFEAEIIDDTDDTIYLGALPTGTVDGARVRFFGTMPAPLVQGTWYYFVNVSIGGVSFQLATTEGGTPINLTTSAAGCYGEIEDVYDIERTTNINHYFPAADFTGRWNGAFTCRSGHSETSCVKITENGEEWMFISLPYAPVAADYTWVKGVIDADPDRLIVLMPHSYLDADATLTPEGDDIWSNLILQRPAANWVMILCGHRYVPQGWLRITQALPNGHTFPVLLSDYQNVGSTGGEGWLRVIQFNPAKQKIVVKTFSPIQNNDAGAYWVSPDNNQNNFELEFAYPSFARGFEETGYGLVNIKCGQQLLEAPVTGNVVATTHKKFSLKNETVSGYSQGRVVYDGDVIKDPTNNSIRDSWKGKGIVGLSDSDYWHIVKEDQAEVWAPPRDARGTGNANNTLEVRKYFNVDDSDYFLGRDPDNSNAVINTPTNANAKSVTALENCGLKGSDNQVLLHMKGINPGRYALFAYGQKTDFDLDVYAGISKSKSTKGKAFFNYAHPLFNYTGPNEGATAFQVNVYPVRQFALRGLKKDTGTSSLKWLVDYVGTVFVPYDWWKKINGQANNGSILTSGKTLQSQTFYAPDDTTLCTNGVVYLPSTTFGDTYNGFGTSISGMMNAENATRSGGAISGTGFDFNAVCGWEFMMLAPAEFASDVVGGYTGGATVPVADNYVTLAATSSGDLQLSTIRTNTLTSTSSLSTMLSYLYTNAGVFSSSEWSNGQKRWCLGANS